MLDIFSYIKIQILLFMWKIPTKNNIFTYNDNFRYDKNIYNFLKMTHMYAKRGEILG